MDVRLPDGTIINNVPDGTTQSDLMARVAKMRAPEDQASVKNLAGAALEPNLSLTTGTIAAPISGFAGIAGSLLPGPEGQGAAWARKTGSALTYEPRTTGGKNAMEAISYPFQKLAEGAQ